MQGKDIHPSLVWRLVRPRQSTWGNQRRWSSVAHLVRIDHYYGPFKEEWVEPICGGKAGRGGAVENEPRCKRCLASRRVDLDAGAGEENKVDIELDLSSEPDILSS